MNWEIQSISPQVRKQMKKPDLCRLINRAIRKLLLDPIHTSGKNNLPIGNNYWRIAVGKYRLIYIPEYPARKVSIVHFDHRNCVYSDWWKYGRKGGWINSH